MSDSLNRESEKPERTSRRRFYETNPPCGSWNEEAREQENYQTNPIREIRGLRTRNPNEPLSPKCFRLRELQGDYQTNPLFGDRGFQIPDLRWGFRIFAPWRLWVRHLFRRKHIGTCVTASGQGKGEGVMGRKGAMASKCEHRFLSNEPTLRGSQISRFQISDCPEGPVTNRVARFYQTNPFPFVSLVCIRGSPSNLRNERNIENSMIETGTEAAGLSFHRPEHLV
jgi:hypothetical protein